MISGCEHNHAWIQILCPGTGGGGGQRDNFVCRENGVWGLRGPKSNSMIVISNTNVYLSLVCPNVGFMSSFNITQRIP